MSEEVVPMCPYCRKEVKKEGNESFPFCCERHKLLDLGAWADEEFKIMDEITEAGD